MEFIEIYYANAFILQ